MGKTIQVAIETLTGVAHRRMPVLADHGPLCVTSAIGAGTAVVITHKATGMAVPWTFNTVAEAEAELRTMLEWDWSFTTIEAITPAWRAAAKAWITRMRAAHHGQPDWACGPRGDR